MPDQLEGLHAVAGVTHVVTERAEMRLEELSAGGLVIDDEDDGHVLSGPPSDAASRADPRP